MNWIERIFGVSPDAGSGAAELAVGFIVGLVVVGVLAWRGTRRAARKRRAAAPHPR
jgi:hypothetical protein